MNIQDRVALVTGANRGLGLAFARSLLARGARKVSAPDSDDLEEQELLLLSHTQVEAALKAGEFKVLAWATIMALALIQKEKQ
jgi:ADP-ribose pyrophosphatase